MTQLEWEYISNLILLSSRSNENCEVTKQVDLSKIVDKYASN